MRYILALLPVVIFNSFFIPQSDLPQQSHHLNEDSSAVWIYYRNHPDNLKPSTAIGTVSRGELVNGKLMPFSGPNFNYFDTLSYLRGRAFVHDKVKKVILESYQTLVKTNPGNHFCFMECSHEHGGKLFPHRTHQNGLSVDFMTPVIKNGKPYYGLDTTGLNHYGIDFDNFGRYTKDTTISINFNLMAAHILAINKAAKQYGLKIKKVIFKMELKGELYATENGKKLITENIYITKKLSPLINNMHDDHYHIDFEIIEQ